MFGNNTATGKSFFRDNAEAQAGKLLVTSMFYTLQGEGPYRGEPAFFIRLAKCQLQCSFCFPTYKTIRTANRGLVAMGDLRKGDILYTLDENLQLTTTKVTKTMRREVEAEDLVNVSYVTDEGKEGSLVCTNEHPFHVKNHPSGKEYIPADHLATGDIVYSVSGSDRIAFKMKQNNPMKNKKTAKKVAKTLSEGYSSGELIPYKRSKKWRKAQAQRMSENNPMFDLQARKSMMQNKIYAKSGLEKLAHKKFKKIVDDIRYVGNKPDFVVGNDEIGYLRPDFVIKGTRKVIEVYDPTFKPYVRDTQAEQKAYEDNRRQHYKKAGYRVIFFKADEFNWRIGQGKGNKTLPDTFKKKEFIRKLCDFVYNGARITSVEPLNKRQYARVRFTCNPDTGVAEVANVSCEPHNHYLIDGLHVHNCDTFFDDGQWLSLDEIDKLVDIEIERFFTDQAKVVPHWAQYRAPTYTAETKRNAAPALKRLNEAVREASGHKRQMVLVITGGEPTLQNIKPLLEWGAAHFKNTQIESNGITVSADALPASTTVVVSPKCREEDRIKDEPENGKVAVAYLKPSQAMLDRADCLKFVMEAGWWWNDPDDHLKGYISVPSAYTSIPDWAHDWAAKTGKPIFLSPMNIYKQLPQKAKELRAKNTETTIEQRSHYDEVVSFWQEGLLDMEANKRNHEWAARYAIEHGFIFNVQIHLLASLA